MRALSLFLCIAVIFCVPLPSAAHENEFVLAEAFITKELLGHREKIDVGRFGVYKSDIYGVFTRIIKGQPYLFYVGTTMSYESDTEGRIISLYPTYLMDERECADAQKFCHAEIARACIFAEGAESEYEKALILHDFLCLEFSYDSEFLSDNMYSFLKQKKGTCQGYTFTYIALLRECGIEATFAASDEMEHIWTLAKIDGEWYHIDVTWDDREGYEFDRDDFLRSDAGIESEAHKNWYSPTGIVCTSDKYDDYNNEENSPFAQFVGSGDVNCDGRIDVLDMVLLTRCETGLPEGHFFLSSAADLDGDLVCTAYDKEAIADRILIDK